jgi:hypothetical protein
MPEIIVLPLCPKILRSWRPRSRDCRRPRSRNGRAPGGENGSSVSAAVRAMSGSSAAIAQMLRPGRILPVATWREMLLIGRRHLARYGRDIGERHAPRLPCRGMLRSRRGGWSRPNWQRNITAAISRGNRHFRSIATWCGIWGRMDGQTDPGHSPSPA